MPRSRRIINKMPVERDQNVVTFAKTFEWLMNLLPNNPALTPSYDLSLSSSTIGGGRVSLSIGGNVTGSTPQKSSVNVAEKENLGQQKCSSLSHLVLPFPSDLTFGGGFCWNRSLSGKMSSNSTLEIHPTKPSVILSFLPMYMYWMLLNCASAESLMSKWYSLGG